MNKAKRVESMEASISEYLKRLWFLDEAFIHKADPVFAVKAGFRDAGIKFVEPVKGSSTLLKCSKRPGS